MQEPSAFCEANRLNAGAVIVDDSRLNHEPAFVGGNSASNLGKDHSPCWIRTRSDLLHHIKVDGVHGRSDFDLVPRKIHVADFAEKKLPLRLSLVLLGE